MKTYKNDLGKTVMIYILLSAVFCLLCFGMAAAFRAACDSDRPAAGNAAERRTFVIDPGHGGEDGGCSGKDGTTEKDINLALSASLADILRASGAEAVMTRTEDILLYDRNVDFHGRKKVLDLKARLDCAKAHPDAVFVSIHMNAFPAEKWRGLQVWYSKNDPMSLPLARDIQEAAKNYIQPGNERRVKAAGSGIFLLDRAVTPAVLIECGFLSNPEECAALSSSEYQKKLALVIAYACLKQSADTPSPID